MIIKQLNGHSGCRVNLIQDKDAILVNKISAGENYNYRLKKQCKKQANFVNNYNVYAPEITECGYEDNLFYFNMEFVKGKTMAEYTSEISISEIPKYIECLFKCLYYEDYKSDPKANTIFSRKISELEEKLKQYSYLKESFYLLKEFDWTCVYKSFCHGDLTLENILITQDKKIYLIDFLDSFYNSWMIDIAKLLQDLELKWSFRHEEGISSNRELRLQVAKDTLINQVLATKNGSQNIIAIYHILLLNILRIYPYAKDKKTIDYLFWGVNAITNKIQHINIGVLA